MTTQVAACTCKIRVGKHWFYPSFVLIQNLLKYVTFSFLLLFMCDGTWVHSQLPRQNGLLSAYRISFLFNFAMSSQIMWEYILSSTFLNKQKFPKQDLRSCLQTWLLEHGFLPSSFAWIVFQLYWFSQKVYFTSTSFFLHFIFMSQSILQEFSKLSYGPPRISASVEIYKYIVSEEVCIQEEKNMGSFSMVCDPQLNYTQYFRLLGCYGFITRSVTPCVPRYGVRLFLTLLIHYYILLVPGLTWCETWLVMAGEGGVTYMMME